MYRSSTCIRKLHVDPLYATATVYFKNGSIYEYTNVSRRAIANLLINRNMSWGFWVNKNCVNSERTQYQVITPKYAWYLLLFSPLLC